MATVKTNKSKTNRKSTKSVMALKKKFRVNKWVALGVVVILAGVGIYVVKQSSASSYTFILNASSLQGGAISNKDGGVPYISGTGAVGAVGSQYYGFIYETKRVCTHLKAVTTTGKGSAAVTFAVYFYNNHVFKTSPVERANISSGNTANLCVVVPAGVNGFVSTVSPNYPRSAIIAVSTVYGLSY